MTRLYNVVRHFIHFNNIKQCRTKLLGWKRKKVSSAHILFLIFLGFCCKWNKKKNSFGLLVVKMNHHHSPHWAAVHSSARTCQHNKMNCRWQFMEVLLNLESLESLKWSAHIWSSVQEIRDGWREKDQRWEHQRWGTSMHLRCSCIRFVLCLILGSYPPLNRTNTAL